MPLQHAMTDQDYNRLPLGAFRRLFGDLPPPHPGSLPGTYRAAFVGPGWLRAAAGPALALTGLGGWCGKEFLADGTAVNLVAQGGRTVTRFPMQVVSATSLIDGRPGLALHYLPGSPFPWMHIVDELRCVDETTLLGMTLVNTALLRALAFPFILRRTPDAS